MKSTFGDNSKHLWGHGAGHKASLVTRLYTCLTSILELKKKKEKKKKITGEKRGLLAKIFKALDKSPNKSVKIRAH